MILNNHIYFSYIDRWWFFFLKTCISHNSVMEVLMPILNLCFPFPWNLIVQEKLMLQWSTSNCYLFLADRLYTSVYLTHCILYINYILSERSYWSGYNHPPPPTSLPQKERVSIFTCYTQFFHGITYWVCTNLIFTYLLFISFQCIMSSVLFLNTKFLLWRHEWFSPFKFLL